MGLAVFLITCALSVSVKRVRQAAGYIFQMCKLVLKFCRVRHYAVSNVLDDLTINDVGKKQAKRTRIHTNQELIDIWQLTESDRFLPYYNYY